MIKVPKDPVPGGSCSSCLIESRRLAMLSHGEERTLVSLPLLAGHQPYYISPYDLIQPSSRGFPSGTRGEELPANAGDVK